MKSKNLCLIIAPIFLVAFIVISIPEIRAQDTLIWTGNAYSATGAPVSTPSLTSGTEYRIEAATIFWYNYPSHLEADAQYYTTITINSDDTDYEWANHFPAPNGHSFLQINGADVNWGSFSDGDTNHQYSIEFTGTGNPITFQVYDWIDQDISNNYCHIEISIYQVTPSPTATPTPSPSPTPTETPAPTPSPSTTPVVTPTPTASPTEIPTETPSPSPSPSPSPTPSLTPSPTPTPTLSLTTPLPTTPKPAQITTPTAAPTPDQTTINPLGELQTTSPLPTSLSNQSTLPLPLAYLTVIAIWIGDVVIFAIMMSILVSNRRRMVK